MTGGQKNGAPTQRKGEERDHKSYWFSNEGLTSELRFHSKVYFLASSVAAGYRKNDLEGMGNAINRLLWVEDHIHVEPFLSIYDSGLVSSLLYIVHACADRYQLEEGYTIAKGCRATLVSKRRRRSELGLPFRADSECWYRFFEAVAELKWKGNKLQRNHLMAPEELIEEYLEVETRCLKNLANSPSKDLKRNARHLSDLGWCLLQIIKMAIRWCPDQHAYLVQRFNNNHGNILALKTGQFIAGKPVSPDNPWYWDHELFKWCILGPATEDEASLCHQWRLDAMRADGTKEVSLEAYRYGTGNELTYLLNIQNPQEVLHVC